MIRERDLRLFAACLLVIGIIHYGITCWLSLYDFSPPGQWQFAALGLAFCAALIPSFNQWINRCIQLCNRVLEARARPTALGVAAAAAGALLIQAYLTRESLFIKINDEHSYMIGAQMLARGRLWMTPFPDSIADFFDAISVLVKPVYASMYFPGTALMQAPGIWLGLPFWIIPLLTASAAVGMFYRMAAELFDASRGLVAALMLVSLRMFRDSSLLLMSEMPLLLAELTLLWAWFGFRRTGRLRWAALMGASAAMAAITRPLDALCVALPVGLAMVCELYRKPRELARAAAMILLAASPFLTLQVVQNAGITGHWHEYAEAYYNQRNFPASPMGFHAVNAAKIPVLNCPPKQQWLAEWVLPSMRLHTPGNAMRTWYYGRLRQTLQFCSDDPLLEILLPLSVLSMGGKRRIVVAVNLLLLLMAYAIYLFSIGYYSVAMMPGFVCMILMGWETAARLWPANGRTNTFILLSICGLSVAQWPPFTAIKPLPPTYAPDQRPANSLLSHLPKTPAVVMFRFAPELPAGERFHDDPVYNDGVAWPDDAMIVRARDLGPEKNHDLFEYYARRQPDRVFYIYDPDARAQGKNPLSAPLGTARELSKSPH